MNKEEFMRNIVVGGDRPPVDKQWPAAFSNLLQSCWHRDSKLRPSFEHIIFELTNLIDNTQSKRGRSFRLGSHPNSPAGHNKNTPPSSTWF